MSKEIS